MCMVYLASLAASHLTLRPCTGAVSAEAIKEALLPPYSHVCCIVILAANLALDGRSVICR